jgi:hypothetical protein
MTGVHYARSEKDKEYRYSSRKIRYAEKNKRTGQHALAPNRA